MTSPETSLSTSLRALADADIAEHSQRFFKTGKGEYGEGDQFLGIRVPVLRQQAKQFKSLQHKEILASLHSPWHEERLCALLILVLQFQRGDTTKQSEIYRLYLDNTHYINNWDLVDTSSHPIIGGYLLNRDRTPLYQLAVSDLLWERRIAMMACYHFIKRDDFSDALAIAEQLLADEHDLIHKVTGWMLREIGKRDEATEKTFLSKHYKIMPRTMLRYAIEKFPKAERQAYLQGRI